MLNVLEWLVAVQSRRSRFLSLSFTTLFFLTVSVGSAAGQSAPPTSTDPMGSEPYTITMKVIAGGGVTSARSPCFELAGTIGQPAAGRSQGAVYTLSSGFWGAPVSTDTIFRSSFEACQP